MDPNNNAGQGGGSPAPQPPKDQNEAAANVIRSQINTLYGDQPVAPGTQTTPHATIGSTDVNPYERTLTSHPQPQADQWKTYHSAWQNYYQQYYAAYYAHQQNQESKQQQGYFSQQAEPEAQPAQDSSNVSKDEALFELRQKLLGKVRKQAKTIRRSRHFIPIAASLAVVLIFVFLQYNRVIIGTVNAYMSPGSIDPQNIVIDPGNDIAVSQDPRLIIPKINVDVPVVYDIGNDQTSQLAAMENGVAHFAIPGASSRPGQLGNTVISGHSSNDLFDKGDYKFIFAQLEKLNEGDTIYANYEGKRNTYVVTKKEVVLPTEVSKLVYPTDKPVMTLITCTPLGTTLKRLLVTAEQISPDPAAAAPAPAVNATGTEVSIPGNSPTLLERAFGAR